MKTNILINKKNFLILLLIVVLLSSSAILCCDVQSINTFQLPDRKPTIVIDAGHGGRDGGVVGKTTKVKESDLNLSISKKLQDILSENGFEVFMTRSTEDGLYGDAKSGRKMIDLRAREAIINDAQPDLVISIHQNSFPKSLERGAQVFYSIGCKPNSASHLVAMTMQSTLNSTLPESDRVAKKGDFYIINCTQFPSVLVECGFLSTPAEEQLLTTDEYQSKVAGAIYDGISKAFELKNCVE